MAGRLAPLLVLLALSAAGCGAASTRSGPLRGEAGMRTSFPQGGFVVRPARLADSRCGAGRGRGVRLPARLGDADFAAIAALPNGSTLIAGHAGKRTTLLYAISPTCAPDPTFGPDGIARVAIPSRLARPLPKYPPDFARNGTLWIGGLAPRRGGGAILVGQYGDSWVIGEITRRGRLDHRFGDGGWSVLPFHGAAGEAVQEVSGRIVIAGDNGFAGCCTRNWAAVVSARGRLEPLGKQRRTELPTGEDSGVTKLVLEPNGDILADVGWGNSGCWGVTPALLTPSGRPVRHFAERFSRFWHQLGLHAFVGDVYAKGNGFVLAGTGQRPCAGTPSLASAPSATGLLARFRTDGRQVGRTIRFPSRMYGVNQVEGFDRGRDTLLIEAPYTDPTRLHMVAAHLDGSIDSRFGSDGRALIRTPWRGSDAELETTVSVLRAGARQIVLVAGDGSRRMQLIRLRF